MACLAVGSLISDCLQEGDWAEICKAWSEVSPCPSLSEMLPSSSFLTLCLPSLPCPMFLGSVCGSCCGALHYALDLGSRLYHGSCAIWVVAAVDFPHLPCSAAELGVLGCSWLPGTLQLNRATLSSLGWPYLCAVLHAAPQSSPFLLTLPVSSTAVWDLPILYHGIPFTHWSSICCNVHVGFSSCPLPCGWPHCLCSGSSVSPFLLGSFCLRSVWVQCCSGVPLKSRPAYSMYFIWFPELEKWQQRRNVRGGRRCFQLWALRRMLQGWLWQDCAGVRAVESRAGTTLRWPGRRLFGDRQGVGIEGEYKLQYGEKLLSVPHQRWPLQGGSRLSERLNYWS